MKQIELSKRVGCSRSTISRILNGTRKPSVKLAEKLANLVKGTTVLDWLYCYQNLNRILKAVRGAK